MRAAAAGACAFLLFAFVRCTGEGEEVDFSVPPPAGLVVRYDLEWHGRWKLNHPGQGRGKTTVRAKFEHVVRRVDHEGVIELERYHDKGLMRVMAEGEAPRDQQIEAKPALRATWDDGRCVVETLVDERWVPIDETVQNRLSTTELRSPILPVGSGVRRVGQEWSVDAHAIAQALAGGGMELGPAEGLRATMRLIELQTDPPGRRGRYAVLEASLRDPNSRMRWDGRALFDLSNRVIVSCEGRGGRSHRRAEVEATTTATAAFLEREDR